jgi:hypothetical protein
MMPDDLPPPPPGFTVVGTPPAAPAADAATSAPSDALPPPPEGFTVINPPSGAELRARPANAPPMRDIADSPDKGAGFWTNLRASLAPDVNDQIRRFAAARFPDLPIDQAVKRYGIVNGHIVYADENGNFARETPSVSGGNGPLDTFIRLGDNVASGVGPAIPAAAATVTGTAMGPTGASIPAAGAAAAATDVGRQALDKWIAGEPLSIDWLNAGGQGLLGAGGQAVGVAGTAALSRNPLGVSAYDRLKAIDPATRQATADLEAEAQRRGVDLSAGQATGLRSVQALERQLGRYPETADPLYDFTRNQRQTQIPAAVRDEISAISPTPPGEGAVGQFREGADKVLGAALDARAAQAQRAYGVALSKDPAPWTPDLEALMQRPSMKEAWANAQKLAAEKGIDLPQIFVPDANGNLTLNTKVVPDWRSWDYIKRGLDQAIDDHTNAVGRLDAMGGAINGTRKDLLSILDAANPDYAAARLQYGAASDTVNQMLDGGLGLLRKLKDADPLDRVAVVRRIFDAGSLTPEEVQRMRTSFGVAGRLDDWNAGFANWLSDKLDAATTAAGRNGNAPAQLYQRVWNDPRQRAIVRAALGGDVARLDGIEKLMQVVDASARGLPEGSPTVTDGMVANSDAGKMISKGQRIAATLLSPGDWLHLPGEAIEGYAFLRAPEKRLALAQTLLSGNVADKLRKLALLSPASEKAVALTADILAQAGFAATPARTPADVSPPAVAPAATQ